MEKKLKTATFASGCFWCSETIFRELKGVEKVVPGYAGGSTENPSYEEVCSGRSGHAEAIQILFDPTIISYSKLLEVFFLTHDPTTLNRQGHDVGTEYRSAIFHHDETQRRGAEEVKEKIEDLKIYPSPIVTEITPFTNFFPAEKYHQDYYAKNSSQPYCRIVIDPKVSQFRKKFFELLKNQT